MIGQRFGNYRAVSLLGEGERRQLLVEWNATEAEYPREAVEEMWRKLSFVSFHDSLCGPDPADMAMFLQLRVLDNWLHEQDIRRALGMPGHLGGPAAEPRLGPRGWRSETTQARAGASAALAPAAEHRECP